MEQKKKWLSDKIFFIVTIVIVLGVIAFGAFFSETLSDMSRALMNWVSANFGWFYILSVVAFIGFLFIMLAMMPAMLKEMRRDPKVKKELEDKKYYELIG